MKRTRRTVTSAIASLTFVAVTGATAPSGARADVAGAFAPAYRGFGAGGVVGLSTGYLVGRSGGWDGDEDWRPLLLGAGIGALVGGGVGLGLGISDMARGTEGAGSVIMRDVWYGAGFGAAAGLIAGGIVGIAREEGAPVLVGTAIGTIAGAGLGLGLGIWDASRRAPAATAATAPVVLTVAAAESAERRLVWMPALVGRY